ncbi:MAG: mycothiol synthase [Nocardioidaceae bacterium]|jgi:mycothiol synthase|nr:mycothiol synthase [Nocardioidaceae bacterium]
MTDGPADKGAPVTISASQTLTAQEAAEVWAAAAAARAADGVYPLDDQVRTEVTFGAGSAGQHVLGRLDGVPPIIAYANVVRDASGASGHLMVHPDHRRRGIGETMVDHLLGLLRDEGGARSGTLRLWAHGDTDGAKALAAARGFARIRDLWQMHRALARALPDPTYPEDVSVRTFEPGRDDEAWVALNAAAFASHPEQGRLTVDDLRHRIEQPWFDPAGFFLAERGGALVGSHWTKIHPAEETGGEPVGEVYAIGIHPTAQGLGLGKALTLTGLHHLRDKGLGEVMLYVDGDNTTGIGLYERLGFTTTTIDAMYASP